MLIFFMFYCQLNLLYLGSRNATIDNSRYINFHSLIYKIFVKHVLKSNIEGNELWNQINFKNLFSSLIATTLVNLTFLDFLIWKKGPMIVFITKIVVKLIGLMQVKSWELCLTPCLHFIIITIIIQCWSLG